MAIFLIYLLGALYRGFPQFVIFGYKLSSQNAGWLQILKTNSNKHKDGSIFFSIELFDYFLKQRTKQNKTKQKNLLKNRLQIRGN